MILRPYQKEAISSALSALEEHGNTLVVAPTGSGKTIMMAETIAKMQADKIGKTVIIQHRLKLVEQNADKFRRVNGDRFSVGILTGEVRQPDCDVVFATVQTLEKNLDLIGRIDYFVIDEAHHAAADSYYKCVEHLTELNPGLLVLGFTATPARADGKGLGDVFTNTAYQVEIDLLIELGYLVQPKSYILDIGVNKEIAEVTRQGRLSDVQRQELMSDIYDPHLPRIVEEWEKLASDRHSIFFCTKIEQAENLTNAFIEGGHDARVVHSKLPQEDNDDTLREFDQGKFHVLINVAILTEGYDCPPTDCVSLVRGCSSQSTMTQMLGRGLRIIEPGEYAWSKKEDCTILDFGDSIRVHGTLRSDANLKEIRGQQDGDDPFAMFCPHCDCMIIVDAETGMCPECGGDILEAVELEAQNNSGSGVGGPMKLLLKEFTMTEAKLTGYSPFAWVDLTKDQIRGLDYEVFMANGFDAHVTIIRDGDTCVGIGKAAGMLRHKVIGMGREKVVFAQANNFMSNNETGTSSRKSAGWLRKPMTAKQLGALKKCGWREGDTPIGRYEASCLLTYLFNRHSIGIAAKEAA